MNMPRLADARLCAAANGGTAPQDQLSVGWLSGAPDLASSMLHALRAAPELTVLADEDRHRADVVVAITGTVDDAFVDAVAAAADDSTNPEQRCVLVSEQLQRRHLPRLVGAGVVCAVPYQDATSQRIVRAICACGSGQSVFPAQLTRWVLDEFRFTQRELLVSQGLAPGGLTSREVEVLRHIAQGDETAEIAAKLSYSERTIKKILQDLMLRLRLNNRAHAVSYAMRVGAI